MKNRTKYCDSRTLLQDEGSLFITTPNRTLWSKLFLIELAEFLRIVPVNTHDYEKLITPRELTLLLKDRKLTIRLPLIIYSVWVTRLKYSKSNLQITLPNFVLNLNFLNFKMNLANLVS